MQKNFSHLVGIPYSELDCFGLCRKFYKDIFDTELKHYYDETPSDLKDRQNLVYTSKGDFVEVVTPEFGDLVLMFVDGLESHVGIYVGDGMILHSLTTVGESCLSRVSYWRRRISGYYRLRESND